MGEPGVDAGDPGATDPGSPRHQPEQLPGGERILPGQERTATVSPAAVSASLSPGTEMIVRPEQSFTSPGKESKEAKSYWRSPLRSSLRLFFQRLMQSELPTAGRTTFCWTSEPRVENPVPVSGTVRHSVIPDQIRYCSIKKTQLEMAKITQSTLNPDITALQHYCMTTSKSVLIRMCRC